MAHYGSAVEYGLHCLLNLVDGGVPAPSARDLAEFQGGSPSYIAKLFTRMEKAGLVISVEGVRGGFRLARPAAEITVLDVVDALEGGKPIFSCREIRRDCAIFGDRPPKAASQGICGIHAIMQEADEAMRQALARHTLADIAAGVGTRVPAAYRRRGRAWFADRAARRAGPQNSRQEPAS